MIKSFNKRILTLILMIGIIPLINSCDFRVIKIVGHQYSSEIKWSKEFKVYLCKYKPDKSSIEKHKKYNINEIFSEYQYTHDGGLFSGFKIDKNLMQIIITDSTENMTWSNDSCSLGFDGFKTRNGYLYYKKFDKLMILDTLKLKIVITNFETNNKQFEDLIYTKEK